MTSRTRKALLFYLGALLGIVSHCRVMSYTAIASAYIPLKYTPTVAGKLYAALVVLAMLGSALWWLPAGGGRSTVNGRCRCSPRS